MPTRVRLILPAAIVALLALAAPARADLRLCNRMSYVVEAAIGVEDKGATATRGWFRIDPGGCRTVMQGELQADTLYVHARALAVYGASPLPQSGNADLCIGQDDFILAAARACAGRPGQKLAPFVAIKPSESDNGPTAYLAEEAEYADDQARAAAIQRLLVIAGYDATPIDGIRGAKTDNALQQFLQDNKLTAAAAARPDFFDVLIAAAQKPGDVGFSWCNDTIHPVMAALGIPDKKTIVTRGWYRIEPGKCLRPEGVNHVRNVYSFAEAIAADGRTIARAGQPMAWGGDTMLCTRGSTFELSDHKDCAGKGLTATGFAAVTLAGRDGTTVRFK